MSLLCTPQNTIFTARNQIIGQRGLQIFCGFLVEMITNWFCFAVMTNSQEIGVFYCVFVAIGLFFRTSLKFFWGKISRLADCFDCLCLDMSAQMSRKRKAEELPSFGLDPGGEVSSLLPACFRPTKSVETWANAVLVDSDEPFRLAKHARVGGEVINIDPLTLAPVAMDDQHHMFALPMPLSPASEPEQDQEPEDELSPVPFGSSFVRSFRP